MVKIIAISGIDGCGKTTVIEKLQEELSQKGLPVKYVWLRYNHGGGHTDDNGAGSR